MANAGHADVQDRAAAVATDLIASGTEPGVQVVVIRRGETVADVAAGVADPATGRMVTPSTPFFAASSAKGVAATVAHVLADRGVVADDLRLADVWPGFGAHGKGDVTLRHVLCHTAGVPGLPERTTLDDLCDWERTCAAIAG